KNHDDFPKLDHRAAPSFWAERDEVIDSPPASRAHPGGGQHDQLGNFQTALLRRITQASTVSPWRTALQRERSFTLCRFRARALSALRRVGGDLAEGGHGVPTRIGFVLRFRGCLETGQRLLANGPARAAVVCSSAAG